MCRDRMDKQRTLDFHLMSRMNRFVDRVTHLHDSQITMKKVSQTYKLHLEMADHGQADEAGNRVIQHKRVKH